MISFEGAMRIYDHEGQHSAAIDAIVCEAGKVTVTAAMVSDLQYEIPGTTTAQAWRALASALKTAGFEVVGD